jgi:mannose-6-phosphate isomerase
LLGGGARKETPFPWLVKFLDACDWLSVQVHPNAEAVRRLRPGEGSKTEAWFVLEAQPGSRIFAGLKPGVDERALRARLTEGEVAACLHSFEPQPGDSVFLPAGTVHAVGGGVLIAEVQQTSDATFRLFDWNRRDAQGKGRTLHIEESLASIDWNQGPIRPVSVPGFAGPGKPPASTADQRQLLARCPFFELEFVRAGGPFSCGGDGRLHVVVVLNGAGSWEGEIPLCLGQVWLLPASMKPGRIQPAPFLEMLLCTTV